MSQLQSIVFIIISVELSTNYVPILKKIFLLQATTALFKFILSLVELSSTRGSSTD